MGDRDPSRLVARPAGRGGYRLDVGRSRVAIRAYRPAGAFYALQTLRQLFPPAIFRQAKVDGVAWTVPAASIEDAPRFTWRGAHLDVARHFMPKEFVKKSVKTQWQQRPARRPASRSWA
ncbi:MAG: glycoside hydrolase family 20 zincin-like fold domain-containing protein [Gemmatimonadales bacterium]